MVEEEINVGVFPGLPANDRAEQVQMLDAKPFQFGFVFMEAADGLFAGH